MKLVSNPTKPRSRPITSTHRSKRKQGERRRYRADNRVDRTVFRDARSGAYLIASDYWVALFQEQAEQV
jgi:hypothetical protein